MSIEIRSILKAAGAGASVLVLVAACSSAGSSPSQVVAGATASPSMSEHPMASESASMSEHPSMSESPMASESAGAKTSMASGSLHGIDGKATGMVALFHLANGSYQVTFENLETTTMKDIHVVLVKNADVMSSSEIDKSAILDLGPLTGTMGMQDYMVPASMAANISSYHSVVLWDTAMAHAIAAAALK